MKVLDGTDSLRNTRHAVPGAKVRGAGVLPTGPGGPIVSTGRGKQFHQHASFVNAGEGWCFGGGAARQCGGEGWDGGFRGGWYRHGSGRWGRSGRCGRTTHLQAANGLAPVQGVLRTRQTGPVLVFLTARPGFVGARWTQERPAAKLIDGTLRQRGDAVVL